jgi:hypothetical protein
VDRLADDEGRIVRTQQCYRRRDFLDRFVVRYGLGSVGEHVGPDLLNRLLPLRQQFRKYVPHVDHLIPYFEVDLHTGLLGAPSSVPHAAA